MIDIVLHPSLYEEFFRPAIVRVFPEGPPEARTFFGRLVVHRNIVQHVGEISARGAEQCVCYSNDVIYAIRDFFASEGLARQYNVPTFVRFIDNKGNTYHFAPEAPRNVVLSNQASGTLSVGDVLTMEVEVDESFSDYKIEWFTFPGDRGAGTPIRLVIERRHVMEELHLIIDLISAEDWHRRGKYDDRIAVTYRVLPPI